MRLSKPMPRALVLGANDDAVGVLEVADGGTFAQELRVRHYRSVEAGTSLS